MNPKITRISGLLGIFLILSGISYFLFDYFLPASDGGFLGSISKKPTDNPLETEKTNSTTSNSSNLYSGPKTEACPINGQLYTQEEAAIWSKRRPLMVMIENHEDSRPQSGLQTADIVYEAVAEGGITRFMGVF